MVYVEESLAAESHTSWGAFAEVAVEGYLAAHAEPYMGAVGQNQLSRFTLGHMQGVGLIITLHAALHLDDVVG